MGGIKNRVFGADLAPRVKQKLLTRQKLAYSPDPGDSVDLGESIKDDKGRPIPNTLSYTTNFGGVADLSSRTPIARLWTALELQRHTEVDRKPIDWLENMEATGAEWEEDGHLIITEEGFAIKKQVDKAERIIYEIGNHNVPVVGNSKIGYPEGTNPNDRVGTTQETQTPGAEKIFPNVHESNDNQYLKPAAGITSVTSETEGAMGVIKKATVNFKVYNFHDFDKIYSRYFCRPGAQVFLDFGWDTVHLYNPRELIYDDKKGNMSMDDALYGSKGVMTKANGDLEVLMGYVTEYDSSINEDGSVDCSVTMTSKNSALLDHSYKENDGLYTKIVHQLDVEIINFAAAHFKNGSKIINPNWNASVESESEWRRVAEKFASSNLGGSGDNTPNEKNTVTGVYWQSVPPDEDGDPKEKVSNSKNVYVSWGFFEDKILNQELGIGKDIEDILEGEEGVVRYDSANSFVRFDENLFQRQRAEKDATTLNFVYPFTWDKSYSSLRDKAPLRVIPPDWQEKMENLEVSYKSTPENEALPKDESKSLLEWAWVGIKTVWNYATEFFETSQAELQTEGVITKLDKQNKRIPLREIFVSVSVIKDAFKNADDIKGALRSVMDSINQTSEEVIDLQFFTKDFTQSKLSVVDKNFINSDTNDSPDFFENLFVFRPHSPSSIVKSYDLKFSTPDGSLGNMIAIQSLSPGRKLFPITKEVDQQLSLKVENLLPEPEVGTIYLPEAGAFAGERIAKRASIHQSIGSSFVAEDSILGNDAAKDLMLDSFSDQFSEIQNIDDIEKSIEAAEDPDEEPESTTEEVEDDDTSSQEEYNRERYGNAKVASSISHYYTLRAKKDFFLENSPTILPVELSLGTYGISTVVPGDVFRVDYLPERYIDLVYFQVTKVSHEVTPTAWTTNLETQMRIRKEKKKASGIFTNPDEIYLSKKILETLNLSYIGYEDYNVKKYAEKLQPIIERPQTPSKFDYIFSFIANDDVTFNYSPAILKFNSVLKTFNDPVPEGIEFEKDGFKGWYESRVHKAVYKGIVYDYYYRIELKKGERYKLLVHGDSWIVVPNTFTNKDLRRFENLFSAIDGESFQDISQTADDMKPECEICNNQYCAENSSGGWLGNSGCEQDGCDPTWCDFVNGWFGDECKPKSGQCWD